MTRKEPRPSDYLIDPLSEVSRRERRNLLAASAMVILIAHSGLIPSKISALGIELSAPAQTSFMLLLTAIIVYFVAAFIIYGLSDFLVWRHKYQDHLESVEHHSRAWTQKDQAQYDELSQSVPSIAWVYGVSKPIAWLRILFEFALPVFVGLYAVWASLTRSLATA